jgi:filamentous hemagglutinin family protein
MNSQQGTTSMRVLWMLRILVAFVIVLTFATSSNISQANPTGGVVTTGAASISSSTNTTNIAQSSQKVSINWNTFNIGSGETVNFLQPNSSSIALNRVIGNNESLIFGSLNANGQVFLINPSGVLFAKGSSVNVGSLVASTLNLTDSNFLAGRYNFSGSGGSVVNNGSIQVTDGGYAALLGSQASNNGIVVAKYGTVALAGGNAVSLDFVGDGLLSVAVDQSAIAASVANNGVIKAAGGQIYLTAQAANDLAATVVNNTGEIDAKSIVNKNGVIVLEGGTVDNSGTLDASGTASGDTGGTVKVLGNTVDLSSTSDINVDGDAGGGTALIGGASHGSGSELSATDASVAAGSIIDANAITTGNGGNVVVWANGDTNYAGDISADGGAVSGNGGSVEVSGKDTLEYNGLVSTVAPNGIWGSLLLDPSDYTIDPTNVVSLESTLATTNTTIFDTTSGEGSNPAGSGNINVNAPVTWTSGSTLTLQANNNININQAITGSSGGLTLAAGGTISSPGAIDVSTFTLNSGNWVQNAGSPSSGSLPNFDVNYFTIAGGTFLRVDDGNGTSGNPYLISDPYGLQGVGGFLSSDFDLDTSIYGSPTGSWNNGAGFTPIGTSANPYTGIFNGQYNGTTYSINNISMTSAATDVGLFGYSNGTLENIFLYGATVTANGGDVDAGTLAGYNGGTVTNVSAAIGAVNYGNALVGGARVGGLVGVNAGTITDSNSSGSVTDTGSASMQFVGGLVGINQASSSISNSFSNSTVTNTNGQGGYDDLGGLAAENDGSVTNSYATGTVTNDGASGSDPAVGGLVGVNTGTITTSYASGNVLDSSQGGSNSFAGLVGFNSGSISQSYASGDVTDDSSTHDIDVGGLVGTNGSSASIQDTYAIGNVTDESSEGTDVIGGLVGDSYIGTTISTSYSSGHVVAEGGDEAGGLLGANAGTLTDDYWDQVTSGTSTGAGSGISTGATGLTDAATGGAFDQTSYTGFDIGTSLSNTWLEIDNETRPMLSMEFASSITSAGNSTLINAHQLQLAALFPTYNYTLGNDISLAGTINASDVWRTFGAPDSTGNYGFSPINDYSGTFTANLDTIDSLTGTHGLFNTITSDGNVNGIELTNVSVTGISTGSNIGAFAAINEGSISNSTVTGTVIDQGTGSNYVGGLVGQNSGQIIDSNTDVTVQDNTSTNDYIGGLVGLNAGTITGETGIGPWVNSYATGNVINIAGGPTYTGGLVGDNAGSISDSFATGNVNVTSSSIATDNVGGLAGFNDADSSINSSYASGNVTDINTDGISNVGGLVGYTTGSIVNTYAIGSVTEGSAFAGPDSVGGLVGFVNDGGSIATSYATGAVTAVTDDGNALGGLVGTNNGSITGGYYDTTSTLLSTGIGVENGSGDSVIAVTQGGGSASGTDPFFQNSYTSQGNSVENFDFGETWYMINGLTRPFLQMEYNPQISNSHQLQLVDMNLSNDYNIYTAVTMPALTSSGMWQTSSNLDGSLSYGFVPIGTSADPFTGYFYGANETITGLTLSSTGDAGLFGDSAGDIVYANLSDESVIGEGKNTGVGGLVGVNQSGGYIQASSASGAVNDNGSGGSNNVGGLVGTNLGYMYDNQVTGGSVSDNSTGGVGDNVGGLVGYNSGAIQSGNAASASVADNSSGGDERDRVGGFIGYNSGEVSYNGLAATGSVVDSSTGGGESDYLGGLIGENTQTLSGNTASGSVTDESTFGGEVDSLGGLVGYNGGSITSSTSTGIVSDQSSGGAEIDSIGGLVGTNSGTITDLNESNESGLAVGDESTGGAETDTIGGLVGSNTGTISSAEYTGGLIEDSSEAASQQQQGHKANGEIDPAETDTLGGLVGYNDGTITDSSASEPVFDQSYNSGHADDLGGLVGKNDLLGSIISSTASGNVQDESRSVGSNASDGIAETDILGGLIGLNYGGLSAGTYTPGNVQDDSYQGSEVDDLGGLIGYNTAALTGLNVTANVHDYCNNDPESDILGGLIAVNTNSVTNSTSQGTVADNSDYGGETDIIGGLVGQNLASGIITGSSSSAVAYDESYDGAFDSIGGLVGVNDGAISNSFATGQVYDDIEFYDEAYDSPAVGYINYSDNNLGGLVGLNVSSGTITNSYATGAVYDENFTYGYVIPNESSPDSPAPAGTDNLGGLVGLNQSGATIASSYATGAVTDENSGENYGAGAIPAGAKADTAFEYAYGDNLGGLVGENDGLISTGNYATGAVTDVNSLGGEGDSLGGLVGYNSSTGMISGNWTTGPVVPTTSADYATGSVTDNATGGYEEDDAGGLVGYNLGSIAGTFTVSGTVSDTSNDGNENDWLGGLVGENAGTITTSYSNEAVTDSATGGDEQDDLGGLVGLNDLTGAVSITFANGSVVDTSTGSLEHDYLGGSIGSNLGSLTNSYATGAVSDSTKGGGQSDLVGGLVGQNDGGITTSYSVGGVTTFDGDTGGGLVGSNEEANAGDIVDSFWDTTTSGTSTGIGSETNTGDTVYGLDDAQMKQSGSYTPDWDFVNTWKAYNGNTYPLLQAFLTPLTVTVGGTTVTYNGSAQSATITIPQGANSSLLLGSVNYTPSGQTAPVSPVNAGQYTIGGLYSSQLGYNIDYTSDIFTIDPKTVTFDVANATGTYGTLATEGGYQLIGVISQDSANLGGTEVVTTTGGAPVTLAVNTSAGGYNEKVTGLTGSAAGNYVLATTGNTDGTLTINPAQLTITANNASKNQGDVNPTFTGVITGLVAGDTASNLGTLIYTTPATQSSGAGTYAITPSGATDGNYQVTYVNGVLTVIPLPSTGVGPGYYGAISTADGASAGSSSGTGNGTLFTPDQSLGFLGVGGYWPLTVVGPGVNLTVQNPPNN